MTVAKFQKMVKNPPKSRRYQTICIKLKTNENIVQFIFKKSLEIRTFKTLLAKQQQRRHIIKRTVACINYVENVEKNSNQFLALFVHCEINDFFCFLYVRFQMKHDEKVNSFFHSSTH